MVKRVSLFVALIVLVGVAAWGQPAETTDNDDHIFLWDAREYDEPWLLEDRNGDGLFDFAVLMDDEGNRSEEALDYNYDGYMDDFYFYNRDVLVRQTIDTNYDGKLDLWIYIYHGVYIERYERDTDFDGEIDLVRDYGSGS